MWTPHTPVSTCIPLVLRPMHPVDEGGGGSQRTMSKFLCLTQHSVLGHNSPHPSCYPSRSVQAPTALATRLDLHTKKNTRSRYQTARGDAMKSILPSTVILSPTLPFTTNIHMAPVTKISILYARCGVKGAVSGEFFM